MAAYSWKISGLYKADAETAGKVLEGLANSPQGLSPATLVEASRSEDAPLHGEFEWRDDVAAEKYRLTQGRGIIQNICVVTKRADGSDVKDRQFVSAPGGQSQYVALQAAISREDWRDHLLEQARGDCKAFLAKYRRIQALSGINSAMETFLHSEAG